MNITFILEGNLFDVWRKFILASVIGVVFSTIYTMVDGIFVGQGAGEAGLAGINLAWPAVTIILGMGLMFGTGSASLISLAVGKGEIERAERIIGSTFKFALVFGVILTILGLIFANPIVKFLGASEDTFKFTKDYFMIVYIMAIPYLFANVLNPLVRADGNPNLSMKMVGVGAIGNIILDWLLVIVLGWGTAGAALATGCGVTLSTAVGLWYFLTRKSNLEFKKEYFIFDKQILIEIFKIGIVSFMLQFSIGLVILVQNHIIYSYGTTIDIAIFSVAGYIFAVYSQLCIGIAQGMQPLIGYHYGANLLERMRKLLYITMSVSVLLGVATLLIIYNFGDVLVGFFGIEEEIKELAYNRVFVFCMGAPCLGVVHTMSAYYQALNKNIQANVISVGRGVFLQMAFAIILPPIIGVEGIFYGQALSDIFSIFIVFIVVVTSYLISRKKSVTLQ
ncbi:MAG: MATE family efflux transporter [Epulopiscium sp. Nele67-Bin005]|nr:MAG: MATE family efflux transporter [Epulopiscium sp. Nele67-Bin005]